MHKKLNLLLGLCLLVAGAAFGQETGGSGGMGGTAWAKDFNKSTNATDARSKLGVGTNGTVAFDTDQFDAGGAAVALVAGVTNGAVTRAGTAATNYANTKIPKSGYNWPEAHLGTYRFLTMGHSRFTTNASATDTNYTVYEYLRLRYLTNATWSTNWSINSALADFVDTNYASFASPHKTASGTNLLDIFMIGINGLTA